MSFSNFNFNISFMHSPWWAKIFYLSPYYLFESSPDLYVWVKLFQIKTCSSELKTKISNFTLYQLRLWFGSTILLVLKLIFMSPIICLNPLTDLRSLGMRQTFSDKTLHLWVENFKNHIISTTSMIQFNYFTGFEINFMALKMFFNKKKPGNCKFLWCLTISYRLLI